MESAGQLLRDLEQRQDEVLEQLAELDEQICAVLRGLGVRPEGDPEHQPDAAASTADDVPAEMTPEEEIEPARAA